MTSILPSIRLWAIGSSFMKKTLFLIIAVLLMFASASMDDELTFGDQESDARIILFRCNKAYIAYKENEKKWISLYVKPKDINLEDGGFADITADVEKAYGGIVGFTGELYLSKIKSSQAVSFEELVNKGEIADYDPAQYRFSGARVIRTKKGLFCVGSAYGKYQLYKDGKILGIYNSALEVENVTGLHILKDPSVQLEQVYKKYFYVFRIGKIYYAYSRHGDFNNWTPMLNKDFGNKLDYFTLNDGETATFESHVIRVNGGKKNYVNAPMFVDSIYKFGTVSYHAMTLNLHTQNWEESVPQKNAEIRRHQGKTGIYLIVYLNKKYWVYRDDFADGKQHLIGKYNTVSKVNEVLNRE